MMKNNNHFVTYRHLIRHGEAGTIKAIESLTFDNYTIDDGYISLYCDDGFNVKLRCIDWCIFHYSNLYFDYRNNFLTIERFAEHYQITIKRAKQIIKWSTKCH